MPVFEAMLVESGIRLVKLWLDISKDEQAERLESRATDPLKALKRSPLDAVAQDKWDDYTAARDTMLAATHTDIAPWTCVRADKKAKAHEAVIRHLLRDARRRGCGGGGRGAGCGGAVRVRGGGGGGRAAGELH